MTASHPAVPVYSAGKRYWKAEAERPETEKTRK
jgi:hypothetical protein